MCDLLKGITTIWMRLFDHKSFLSGEIKFALKEFEQTRNDREVETLFSILENIAEIKDNQVDRTQQAINLLSPSVQLDLDKALQAAKAIENLEQKYKLDILLEVNREDRKVEWQQFVDNINENCKQIDKTFEEKEQELVDFYTDLENKLHLNSKLL